MKKITKKLSAMFLAVLMLFATVFTVRAEGTQSFTVQCAKKGYTFKLFQIATFNETTGAYDAKTTDTNVKKELGENLGNTQALREACDTVSDAGTLGALCGEWFTTGADKDFSNLAKGIYYLKCTGVPTADAAVLRNSIVVLPGTDTFSVDDKVKDGSAPNVDTSFGDDAMVDKSYGANDVITYKCAADITGTSTNKLEKFVIKVNMDDGLDKEQVAIQSVQAVSNVSRTGAHDIAYEKIDDTDADFAISIKSDELNQDSFYGYSRIVVTFTTKLTADAPVNTAIKCQNTLVYKFANQDEVKVEGSTVSVMTYGLSVKAKDSTNALSGVKFAVYTDEACTDQNQLATATSGSDGIAKFAYRFATGTYYVKAIEVPGGYNPNATVVSVNITGDSETSDIIFSVTKTAVPNTGDVGTMIFTLGGVVLIAFAGLMLVVLKKKEKNS